MFTVSGRTPIEGYYNVKKLLPGNEWSYHDLRRTFASGLARLGVSLAVIEKLLNHTGGSFAGVVGIYQRYSFGSEMRAATELWARHVEQLAGNNVIALRA